MPTWPPSLPQSMPVDSPEMPQDNVVRTEKEHGPEKKRVRYTAVPITLEPDSNRFVMNGTQLAAFKNFFYVDTAYGTLRFDWADPLPGYSGIQVMRFYGDMPKWQAISSGTDASRLYRVTCKFEILPE